MFLCNSERYENKFSMNTKRKTKLEKNYCNTIVSELKNELSNFYHFEQVDSIFQSLRILIREKENVFKLDTLYTALSRTNIQIDPKKTAEFLFDRSIIGLYLENNDMPFLRFKYREDRMSPIQIYDSDRLTLHKSIYKYFTTHN